MDHKNQKIYKKMVWLEFRLDRLIIEVSMKMTINCIKWSRWKTRSSVETGLMGGCKSHFKVCLQQYKIRLDVWPDRPFCRTRQCSKCLDQQAPELLLPTSFLQSSCPSSRQQSNRRRMNLDQLSTYEKQDQFLTGFKIALRLVFFGCK